MDNKEITADPINTNETETTESLLRLTTDRSTLTFNKPPVIPNDLSSILTIQTGHLHLNPLQLTPNQHLPLQETSSAKGSMTSNKRKRGRPSNLALLESRASTTSQITDYFQVNTIKSSEADQTTHTLPIDNSPSTKISQSSSSPLSIEQTSSDVPWSTQMQTMSCTLKEVLATLQKWRAEDKDEQENQWRQRN